MVCKLYYRKAGSGDGVWEVRGRKRRERGKESLLGFESGKVSKEIIFKLRPKR